MARPADPHTREALVTAARAEFARRGLRGARVEDITAACGVSKGAFYLHFDSKESLFGGLVAAFRGEMDDCYETRKRLIAGFDRQGALRAADVARRSARYCRFLDLEAAEDLRALEVMWRFRDVLGVLLTGSQGTPFEGAVWELAERESQRIADHFAENQRDGVSRRDVAPELFGALIVGTYLQLGQRMVRLEEKPDLAGWARTIQSLVRDGAAPARALQTPSAARALSPAPTARRKPARRRTAARTLTTRSSP